MLRCSWLALSITLVASACGDGGGSTDDECPAGSGAIFVEDGPEGPGCYCPAGTFPNQATQTCVANPCAAQYGAFAVPDALGACVDVDECAAGTAGCDPNATCANNDRAAPTCTCKSGYDGDGKTCTADECPEGYAKKPGFTDCQDIDECFQEEDDCGETQLCFNNPGGYECACHAGFEAVGDTCVCPDGTTDDGGICRDDDECELGEDDCAEDGGRCLNVPGSWACECAFGYEGDGQHCLEVECGPGFEFETSGTWAGTCQDVNECSDDTDGCDANQICINLKGGVRCDCPSSTMVKDVDGHCVCKEGFTLGGGPHCQDVNECTGNAAGCSADATCTNTSGGFVCRCKTGFEGDGKTCVATPCAPGYQTGVGGCVDTNECDNGTAGCSPDATCINTVGGFACQCKTGYTGNGTSCTPVTCGSGYRLVTSGAWAGTCQDINECYEGSDDCHPNATCQNKQGGYQCVCQSGFTGNGQSCTCAPGTELSGTGCVDINECARGTDDCADTNATCTNLWASFSCRCNTGFQGDGTTCAPSPCAPGYQTSSGGTCVDADECALGTAACDPDATCTNLTGSYRCTCKLGFTGTGEVCDPIQCGAGYQFATSGPGAGGCVDVNECAAGIHDCGQNATCANTAGGFACACTPPFVGDGRACTCPTGMRLSGASCVDINECADNVDDCGQNATCTNLVGAYACRCNNGYQGDGRTCVVTACSAGFETPEGGGACVDVDECARGVDDCDPNASCTDTDGAFTCACNQGYTGTGKACTLSPCASGLRFNASSGTCQDIDECAEGTAGCHVNATCNNTSGSFTCTCRNGYSGNGTTTCNDVDECTASSDNCAQICTNTGGGYECSCNDGFVADLHFCQEVNECADPAAVGCLGECVNTAGGFQCFGEGGISSLANPAASPYPNMQCAGAVGPEALWFQTNQKTSFPVDCRCPQGASEPGHFLCAAPTGAETVGLHFGAGPNAADHTNGYLEGCATDYGADVVYFGVTWGDSRDSRRGFVFAMNPTNGNRTVVSGQHYDPALGLVDVGAGNRFDSIRDLALGSDGFLYVFEDSVPGTASEYEDTNPDLQGRSIYKVNLQNGNRTLVWTMNTMAHPEFVSCSNGKPVGGAGHPWIDIRGKQFELDDNDDFILATNRNMSPSPGNGFIRVANDGKSCTWITREGTEPGNLLFGAPGGGSGVVIPGGFDSGFGYRAGKIYATNFLTGRLFEVDVASGQRKILWSGANPVLGTGPGPGMYNFFYYPHFDLWVAGGNDPNTPSYAALFDPASGDTWGWMYQRPTADSTGTVGGGSGGNDDWGGPLGVTTNQVRGPILGVLQETLHHRPWCISPTEPNRLFVATDRVGIVKVEVETGNSMNFSQ